MKKTITTLFLTTAIALGFAQEQTVSANAFAQPKAHFPVDGQSTEKNGMVYLKMGVADSELPKNDQNLMPALGLGYRVAYGHNAVDVSAVGDLREIRDAADVRVANYSVVLPKVNYLFYATPASNNSFYAGAGVGFGLMKHTTVVAATAETVEGDIVTPATLTHNDVQEFAGFIPNVVTGYVFNLKGNVKTFIELDASQPAIKVAQDGKLFGPKVALSVGAGF